MGGGVSLQIESGWSLSPYAVVDEATQMQQLHNRHRSCQVQPRPNRRLMPSCMSALSSLYIECCEYLMPTYSVCAEVLSDDAYVINMLKLMDTEHPTPFSHVGKA